MYNGIRAKNFFYTDTYRELAKDKNLRLVMAVPSSKFEYYRHTFGAENVTFEPLDIVSEPWFGMFLAEIAFNMLGTKTIRFKQKLEYRRYHNWKRYIIKRMINRVFGPFTFLRGVLRWMDQWVDAHPGVVSLLDTYKPDLVLAPDIVFPVDRIFMRAAQRNGYPIIGLARSWDNLTSKGVIQILPDKLILHTTRMKRQAASLVGMREKDMAVTGPPDYDDYFKGSFKPRNEFLAGLGIPINRRVVLFAPFYDDYTGSALIMLNALIHAIKDGGLPHDVHLLVRYRPSTPEIDAGLIEKSDHVTFTSPCEYYFPVVNKVQVPTIDWEFSPKDNELMVNSVYHSNVMVITYSTLAIDAAACDRPIIGIRFDADPHTPLKHQVTKIHDAHDHYSELEAAGGVRLVNNMDEFIESLKFYLDHPEADRKGRKKMVREQVEFTDGQNGKRAAAFIREFVYALK